MKLNDLAGPCLIMAGSGMCNGGRILHHLKQNLWREGTSVLIVGYQGEGSLGRRLVDREKVVSIFGEKIAVKASIHTLNGFSAHAGQTELLKWIGPLAPRRPRVFLTHGEARGREPLAAKIAAQHHLKATLPNLGDTVEL
jgi:metallo-beta-lactamase family protein